MGRGGILKLWKSLIALRAPPPLSHTAHLGWPRVLFNGRLHRCVGSRESVCTEGHVGRSEIPEGGGTEPHRALVSRLSVSLPPQSLPGPSLQKPLLAPDSSAAQPVLLVWFVVERDSSHEKQLPKFTLTSGVGETLRPLFSHSHQANPRQLFLC